MTQALQVYGRVAVALHWLVAGLVVVVGGLGLLFDILHPYKPALLNIHAIIGIILYVSIAVRIGWRLRTPAPDPVPGTSRLMAAVARLMHGVLYVFLIVIPSLGLISFLWHARAFDLGFVRWTPIPIGVKSIYQPTQIAHIWLSYALMASVAVHLIAALWHHFIWRDGTMARMIPFLSQRS